MTGVCRVSCCGVPGYKLHGLTQTRMLSKQQVNIGLTSDRPLTRLFFVFVADPHWPGVIDCC